MPSFLEFFPRFLAARRLCVGNFVISRLCKLFFPRLARERTRVFKKAGEKFYLLSAATTQSLLLLKTFSLRFSKLYESLFSRKLFLEMDIGRKTCCFSFVGGFRKSVALKSWSVTWLATGSRMDSMVFVWKTGIVWR